MARQQQTQSTVRHHARTACQSCRRNRTRCIGGPPCENCVRLGKDNCEFAHTLPSNEPVAQEIRPDGKSCLPCRMEKAVCNGGPPCENCVTKGREVYAFDLEPRKERRLRKNCTRACLPCRLRKIRCTGGGPPCGTCTTRGVESTCEFTKNTNGGSQDKGMHTMQHQSDGDGESPGDPILETETPSLNPLTTLDMNAACRNESLGCSEASSTTSNVTPLSGLSKTPSLVVSGSDKGAHAASLVGCCSHMKLLDVLPSCQRMDCLIEKYFTSISMVKLIYQNLGICLLTAC